MSETPQDVWAVSTTKMHTPKQLLQVLWCSKAGLEKNREDVPYLLEMWWILDVDREVFSMALLHLPQVSAILTP
jgi:hypothetical protein